MHVIFIVTISIESGEPVTGGRLYGKNIRVPVSKTAGSNNFLELLIGNEVISSGGDRDEEVTYAVGKFLFDHKGRRYYSFVHHEICV